MVMAGDVEVGESSSLHLAFCLLYLQRKIVAHRGWSTLSSSLRSACVFDKPTAWRKEN